MTKEEAAEALKVWEQDLINRLGDIDTEPFEMAIEALESNVHDFEKDAQ